MKQASFRIPNMYGDHHVMYVKQLLQQLDGVEETLASAAFQEVDVAFDPEVISTDDIEAALTDEGYLVGLRSEQSNVGLAEEMVPRHVKAFSEAMTSDNSKWALPEWRSSGPLPCPGFEYRDVAGEHPADQ